MGSREVNRFDVYWIQTDRQAKDTHVHLKPQEPLKNKNFTRTENCEFSNLD